MIELTLLVSEKVSEVSCLSHASVLGALFATRYERELTLEDLGFALRMFPAFSHARTLKRGH